MAFDAAIEALAFEHADLDLLLRDRKKSGAVALPTKKSSQAVPLRGSISE